MKHLIYILTAALVLAAAPIPASAKAPSVSARSAVLYEPQSDAFLYDKDGGRRLPMASTTKIMTALVAIRAGELDREFTVDDRAVGVEGSSIYLKRGEAFTMRELIYALLLQSANDAAAAIAYRVAGDIPAFAGKMNALAEEIGLSDTHFTNPHGLDDPEHYTTAADLALLAAFALEDPTFAEVAATVSAKIENADGTVRPLHNHNKLLRLYDGAIGVKTGFTKTSGRCLVSAAERDGVRLIAVTLDAPDDWNDHIKLYENGFSSLSAETLLSVGALSYTVPVIGGEAESVPVSNVEALALTRSRDAGPLTRRVRLTRYTAAPVKAGDILGEVTYYDGSTVVARVPLCARRTVDKK